jgi:hypothetical protein
VRIARKSKCVTAPERPAATLTIRPKFSALM